MEGTEENTLCQSPFFLTLRLRTDMRKASPEPKKSTKYKSVAQGLPVLPALQLGCWVGSEIRMLIRFCSRWSLQLVDTLCSVLYSVLMTVTLSEFL